MSLFQTKPKPVVADNQHDVEIAEIIQRRRYQILVHSLIYYELDTNLISDHQWSAWAEELVQLQSKYPEVASEVLFADAFKNFDGSTGFDLPFRDEQIVNIAYRLLKSSGDTSNSRIAEELIRIQTTQAEYSGFYSHHPAKESKKSAQSTRKAVSKVEQTKRKKLF